MPGAISVANAHNLRHIENVLFMRVGDSNSHTDMSAQPCCLVQRIKCLGNILVRISILDTGNAETIGQFNGILCTLNVLCVTPVRQFAFYITVGFQQNPRQLSGYGVFFKCAAFGRWRVAGYVQQLHGLGVSPGIMAGVVGQQYRFIFGDCIQPFARRIYTVALEELRGPLTASNPLRLRLAGDTAGKAFLELQRRAGSREVALKQMLQAAPGRMSVGIVDAGHCHFLLQIHDRCIVVAIPHDLVGGAHRDYLPCFYRDRFCPRLLAVCGIDLAVLQNQVSSITVLIHRGGKCMKRYGGGQYQGANVFKQHEKLQ
ncbi:hypothetical protein D3C76_866410 [compost metagenome]